MKGDLFMLPLLYFILGIITVRYVFPLLDQLLAWCLQAIEVKKGKLLVKQTECEKEISDIAIKMEQPTTNPIGFCIPTEPEEEEYEDDDL